MTIEAKSLTLKPKEDRRLLRGHLWVYRNELQKDPALPDGTLVDIFNESRRFIGRGFYQAEGGIAARILTRHQEEIDTAFWRERLDAALAWREKIFAGSDVYRWIFGESDGLPGLVIDRYGSVVACSTSSVFYQQHAQGLLEALLRQPGITGGVLVYNNHRITAGEVPERLQFEMDGLQLELDLVHAQKTGLFLDQRRNSQAVRTFAPGARVFDGHCYHGVWACHAAVAGASQVTAVDSSAAAIEQARRNAELNGVGDRCSFITGDVEEQLKGTYDLVILDPPAFAKNRVAAKKAIARYQALNTNAMKAVAPGGMLITSSCSHFVSPEEFVEVLKRAAAAAKRQAWLVDLRGASPDHPVSLQMPETSYLKCAFLRVT